MLRNDYRRALIMLRSLRQGVSGYVRLERRTLMGTLQFTINGAGLNETLYALLLYEQNGLWQACLLDRMGEPRYGQCGAVCRFDPRSICGRALEDYARIAVASVREDVCELLLAGYMNGAVLTDWQQVKQAVCQAIATSGMASANPRQDVPAVAPMEAKEPAPPIPAISGFTPEEETAVENRTSEPESEQNKTEEEPIEQTETISASVEPEPSKADPPEPSPSDESAVEIIQEESQTIQDEFDQPAQEDLAQAEKATILPDEFDLPAQPGYATASVDLPELDVTAPWPAGIEPLRGLFASTNASHPFEAEGFRLIEVPLAIPGAQKCVVGVSASDGQPDRVLYGVPGQYAAEPPEGLEDYEWRGGSGEGYWVTIRPV